MYRLPPTTQDYRSDTSFKNVLIEQIRIQVNLFPNGGYNLGDSITLVLDQIANKHKNGFGLDDLKFGVQHELSLLDGSHGDQQPVNNRK